MMDIKKELKEWTITYVKSRDVMQKTIVGIEEFGDDFVVRRSSGEDAFLIRAAFSNVDEIAGKGDSSVGLVLLNTRENLNAVISGWDKLCRMKGLRIYFVNPKASGEKKWLLAPYTHERISDRSSLKKGLESLFSMVEPYQ